MSTYTAVQILELRFRALQSKTRRQRCDDFNDDDDDDDGSRRGDCDGGGGGGGGDDDNKNDNNDDGNNSNDETTSYVRFEPNHISNNPHTILCNNLGRTQSQPKIEHISTAIAIQYVYTHSYKPTPHTIVC